MTAVTVNGRKVEEKVLAGGDRIRIERSPELRFYLPCPLSPTAVVRLDGPSMLPGKALDVILLDQFLIIGSKGFSHIKTSSGPRQLVLFMRNGAFWAKTDQPILGSGDTHVPNAAGDGAVHREQKLHFDRKIAIDGLSFTLTEAR